MKRKIVTVLLLASTTLFYAQKFEKKIIHEKPLIETYHETYKVEDNYQWLEDLKNEEVINWVKEQNKISKRYLESCSKKTNAFRVIGKYSDTDYDYKIPYKKGKFYFSYFVENHLKEASLYFKPSLKNDYKKIVDPAYIGGEGRVRIEAYYTSKDSRYLTYFYSRDGGDWREARIVDLKRNKHFDETLKDIKFSNAIFVGEGFYYKKFPRNSKFDADIAPQIYYHKIGTPQSEDQLIFERKNKPHIELSIQSVKSKRYLILSEKDEQKGIANHYYYDFSEEVARIRPLARNLKTELDVLEERKEKGTIIANIFDKETEKTIVVEINPKDPRNWKQIIPAYENSHLVQAKVVPSGVLCVFKEKLKTIMTFYNFEGEILYRDVQPIAANVGGFMEGETEDDIIYKLKSYTVPNVIYEFNTKTFEKELNQKTGITFNAKSIRYKEHYIISRDGKEIPVIMVYDEEKMTQGKPNPTLIETYGGFGSISSPYFKPEIVHFIKKGGIYVYAYVRGTGGFGNEWIEDGKALKKQNTINDLIDVSEFLIKENYTSNEKLAIKGGSHGGFVVAAAGIQRPDLYKVVIPEVAPLDMVRKEKFTVGKLNSDEYGSVETLEGFNNLYKLSPYHNIKEDINYPAMLVVTSDNDERVPPFHSYKFVAKLLNRKAQTNPILLKVEKNSGHYGGTNSYRGLREKADIYGFIMNTLEMK
ncbi:prolyl oligopeptidase family serine peptidase [Aureivirga marina]|uniref:prolyl oligopeptidase family serine peptidase n=1 Tax=Aureivirga marina TaxID=1182451 RepID=UPI0018CA705F|nr:prolyl oligopeptidase family serine peptidase [Aureivirga marina]